MRPSRALLLCFGLVVFAGGCRSRSGAGPKGTPDPVDPEIKHLVLISLDTLRADFLPVYGHPYVKTPHLDEIAAQGIVFDQHINCAPSTLASHTSLFTGKYPHTHGTPRNGFIVPDENEMLSEVLADYGFQTAGFLGAYALASAFHFNQGFQVFDEYFDVARSPTAVVSAERYANTVTDAALAWLDKAKLTRLFLFVHYFDIHSPYTPPPPYQSMYFEPGWKFAPQALNVNRLREAVLAGGKRDLPAVNAIHALYGGEITFTDYHLGRLLDELRKRGILDRSLLVITSDHGETFTEHRDLFNHGQEVYETTVRTPLIVRFPKGRHGGRRVGRLVSNVDVMPTLLDWLGIEPPPGMDGQSFAGILESELPPRPPVFCEATQPWSDNFEGDSAWRNARKSRCIRTQQYKLIHRPLADGYGSLAQQWELYDLQADPNERTNLLDRQPENVQPIRQKLTQALAQWNAQADPLESSPEMSDQSIKALKDLGYAK